MQRTTKLQDNSPSTKPSKPPPYESDSRLPRLPTFRHFKNLISDWWLWELICLAASALNLCFIALLLVFYNNQALPKAWPLGITLNTYIAILSAFFKYTLAVSVDSAMGQLKWMWFQGSSKPLMDFERFDQASRGPWGSLSILVRTKGRYVASRYCDCYRFAHDIILNRRLASLGAWVTILSLALDPFFQQIVTYPQRPNLQGGSTVPRSLRFQTVNAIFQMNGTREITGDDIIATIVADWMMNGGANNQLSPYCPSNDCEWLPFRTLGICSNCADISEELQFGCQNEIGDWRPGRTTQPPNSTLYPPTRSCGYFFNISGEYPMLAAGYATNDSIPADSNDALLSRLFRLRTPEYPNDALPYWNGSLKFQNISMPIVDFVTISSANATAVYNNQTPIAHECTLQWCAKSIQASYSGGNYTEKVLSTFENNTFTGDPIVSYVNQYGVVCDDFLANVSIDTGGENFFVDNVTAWQTIINFMPYIPTYSTVTNISSTPEVRYFDGLHNEEIGAGPRRKPISSLSWLPPNNVPNYVQQMATSLTNSIRTYPNSSVLVPGSGAFETFIQARWGWLALPLILFVVTFIFLVLTIHKSSSSGDIRTWKNSALAVLLNGLTDDARKTVGPPGELSVMWERARKVKVRLDPE